MIEKYIKKEIVLPPIKTDEEGFPTEESIKARTTPANTSNVFQTESRHGGPNDGDVNGPVVC